MFWMRKLHLGPVHLSLVRNAFLARSLSPVGWFVHYERAGFAATVRVRSICLNLDCWL